MLDEQNENAGYRPANNKIVIITLCILLGLVALLFSPYLILYVAGPTLDKMDRGTIDLPNHYGVFQVAQEGPYNIELNDKPIVKEKVVEVGWDARYVVFKRINENTNMEIGVLDTATKKVKTLPYNEQTAKSLYEEFGISPDVTLKNVKDLWPDMSKRR